MSKNDKQKENKKEKYSVGLTDVSGKDGFYRPKIETGRWSLGMEIMRANFVKLIGFNLFMLLFIAPIAYLILMREAALSQATSLEPFSANLGLGFMPAINITALPEFLQFKADWSWFIYLPLAILWLGVGLSGGMFVMRNLAWGERVRVYKTFFLGVKRNVLTLLVPSAIFGVVLTASMLAYSYTRYIIALNGSAWYLVVSQILLIIIMIYTGLWYLTAVSMGVTYNSGIFALIKNALIVNTVLLPLNAFFAAFGGLIFALLLLGQSFMMLAFLFILMFGVSFFTVVWTVYTQWLFDKFINPNIKNKYEPTKEEIEAKKLRDKIEKQAERNDGFVTVGQGVMADLGDVKPITEGEISLKIAPYYTRADLERLAKDKAAFESADNGETK